MYQSANSNTMRKTYRPLTDYDIKQIDTIKDIGEIFCKALDLCGDDREFSLAKTKVEEAVMWATKGITK